MPNLQSHSLGRLGRSSLADAVYESVLNAILSGELASGTELSEVALAADLEVSRTPVHEALRRLVIDGLVEPMTNRQVRVVRLTARQIHEVYEMRLLLEPAAAERAATRLTEAQLEALRDAAGALTTSMDRPNWPTRAIDFDIRFHDTLAAACDHDRLQADITRYRRLVRAFCRATGNRENLQNALHEHLAILAALEARDPAAARTAMTTHIAARMQTVLSELTTTD